MQPIREVSFIETDQMAPPIAPIGAAAFGGMMVLDIDDQETRAAFCLMYAALIEVNEDHHTYTSARVAQTISDAIKAAERMGVRA